MAASTETTTILAQCHCKANIFTAIVPTSSLPLTASKCHCNSCRHVSGSMYLSDVPWPNQEEDLSRLRHYAFSDRIVMYFCPTCFCHMIDRLRDENRLTVFAGTINNLPRLLKFNVHMLVADTVDGGATMWMRHSSDGTPAPRWSGLVGKSEELSFDWPAGPGEPAGTSTDDSPRPEFTPIWCHCKGVKLFLRSGADLTTLPPGKIPAYIDKETGKYLAHADACDSCITTNGADIAYWTMVPFNHLSFTDNVGGEPDFKTKSDLLDAVTRKDPRVGTLGVYHSSEKSHRFSCSRCSASIFFAGNDRPEEVDIAIGVLDHPDGARAEGILKWELDQVYYAEDGKGGWREDLYASTVKQAAEWQKREKIC